MNVASLELSKELYELSGWADEKSYFETVMTWYCGEAADDTAVCNFSSPFALKGVGGAGYYDKTYPAYDLGYLLRKLPYVSSKVLTLRPADHEPTTAWHIGYGDDMIEADTPEDAAAKLCIDLVKQGVL